MSLTIYGYNFVVIYGLSMQLVVSWHMKAATMCEFSRHEFVDGLEALG